MKFKSSVITQASGSVGGLTYAHNRGGMYTRARSIPTNPNTERQQWLRSAFGGRIQAWSMLTDSERNAWKVYADNTPFTDKLGDQIKLTGQQQFVRSNTPRANARAVVGSFGGLITIPDITTAPTIYNTGEPVYMIGEFSEDSGAIEVVANLSEPASAAGHALLYVGNPQNPGRAFYKGPYQLAAFATYSAAATQVTFGPDTSDPETWYATIKPMVGMWLPVRINLSYSDGRLSQDFKAFVEVTTDV